MPEDRESRLFELRRLAESTGTVDGAGVVPAGSPIPVAGAATGYYGQPLLKPPVWTWEVPAYFFVGGTAGAAAVIGAVARLTGANAALSRDARWIAVAGAAASPPLLISDLGRPERFLNMLRVVKVRSPMSVGVWTLVAFSQAAAAAAFADLLHRRWNGRPPVRVVRNAADVVSASTGLALATYTGVLIGATAVPAWSENVDLLPMHFGASSVGAAGAMLELLGHRQAALNRLGIGAAAMETLLALELERRARRASRDAFPPTTRLAGALAGPVPLLLRLLAPRSRAVRTAAALSAVAGSLLNRIAWLEAGRRSTR